jgi:hypothetical protein
MKSICPIHEVDYSKTSIPEKEEIIEIRICQECAKKLEENEN